MNVKHRERKLSLEGVTSLKKRVKTSSKPANLSHCWPKKKKSSTARFRDENVHLRRKKKLRLSLNTSQEQHRSVAKAQAKKVDQDRRKLNNGRRQTLSPVGEKTGCSTEPKRKKE